MSGNSISPNTLLNQFASKNVNVSPRLNMVLLSFVYLPCITST